MSKGAEVLPFTFQEAPLASIFTGRKIPSGFNKPAQLTPSEIKRIKKEVRRAKKKFGQEPRIPRQRRKPQILQDGPSLFDQ